MLNQTKVNKLNKEQKAELEKLQKEYNEASSAIANNKRMSGNKELQTRHGIATKNLADFYTKHQLLR